MLKEELSLHRVIVILTCYFLFVGANVPNSMYLEMFKNIANCAVPLSLHMNYLA